MCFAQNLTYYADIMLDAFAILLCSKLCWHNWLNPTRMLASHSLIGYRSNSSIIFYTPSVSPRAITFFKMDASGT